jgi:flagellar biosynthesis protein
MEKKKIKEAAALKYSPQKGGAPEIVALGKGEIAEKIIEKAIESDVPLYEYASLVHTLNYLKIGDEIPEELYEVVAQIMVFVSHLDSSYKEKWLNKNKKGDNNE